MLSPINCFLSLHARRGFGGNPCLRHLNEKGQSVISPNLISTNISKKLPKELTIILIERTWIPASAEPAPYLIRGMTKSDIRQSINKISITVFLLLPLGQPLIPSHRRWAGLIEGSGLVSVRQKKLLESFQVISVDQVDIG